MKDELFTSRVLTLHAEDAPLPDVSAPGPHQRYRHPRMSIEERTLKPLAPGWLRIRMLYAGICGTEVHLVQASETGYVRSSAPALIPAHGRVIGHEGVGEILCCGDNTPGWEVGQMVAFESIHSCGQCRSCRRGAFNQCQQAVLLGMEMDGLFGTVVDVPARLANSIGQLAASSSGLQAAACLEPAGVAWVACERANLHGGENILIFGGGPIGIYCAMLAREMFGAAHVHLIDPVACRRELASRWCTTSASVQDTDWCGHPDFDAVFEASGCLENISAVFRHIGANGQVILLARSGSSMQLDAVDHLITQGISIHGSRGHLGGAFERLIALQAAGKLKLESVVTSVIGAEEGDDPLGALLQLLQNPARIVNHQCKVLVKLG